MKAIKRIIEFTRPFRSYYVVMSIAIVVLAILNQVVPLLTKQIVDLIVARLGGKTAALSSIVVLLLGVLITDIMISVVTDISQFYSDIQTSKLHNYLSGKFYKHLLSLSVNYFDNEITGRIINKLDRGITSIVALISQMLNNFLPFLVSTIITLCIISLYSWQLALLLFLLFPIYITISHASSVAWGKVEGEKNVILDETNGRVTEVVGAIRMVKSFMQELVEHESFLAQRKELVNLSRRQTGHWHLFDFYRRLVLNIIMFGVFAYIIYFTFLGRFTLGQMTLLLQLANQARFPLFAMSFIIGQIQQAEAGSSGFFEVLDTPVSIRDAAKATVLKHVKGDIAFNNVHFSYRDKGTVLRNISFNLKKGEKMAVVGESGEGKSTLVNLLLRFYEPQQGTITVDKKNIQFVTQASLHQNIGVVTQESYVFSGTIMENIKYGKYGATDEDVIIAAKSANADEFIQKTTERYQTEIGERGVRLSGGQKQRISIARAILKNAPILVLDEATSSLDSKSELLVQEGLTHLTRGKTTIIIAHRLSTLSGVDKILVLSGGKIAQFGTPKELLRDSGGLYAKMITLQKTLLGASEEERAKALRQYDLVG